MGDSVERDVVEQVSGEREEEEEEEEEEEGEGVREGEGEGEDAGPLQTDAEIKEAEVRLQVRYPNGTTLKCGFPRTATLGTLRRYIAAHGPDDIGAPAQVCLSLSFPRRELPHTDDARSLADIEIGTRVSLFASQEP
jgi:hypothetical protein